jgi:hypothetical protein
VRGRWPLVAAQPEAAHAGGASCGLSSREGRTEPTKSRVSSMMEYEPIQGALGRCIGCGAVAAAFSQCLSCGAPVEPDDNSWHYSFGWVEGPRPE